MLVDRYGKPLRPVAYPSPVMRRWLGEQVTKAFRTAQVVDRQTKIGELRRSVERMMGKEARDDA